MYQVLQDKNEWDSCIAETGINTVFCSRNFSQLYCSGPEIVCVSERARDCGVCLQSGERYGERTALWRGYNELSG